MVFFKIWPENIKKAFITLQALRFKLNSLNQTSISPQSTRMIMQLTKTISFDSVTFIAKKTIENLLWAKKVSFCGQKKMHHRRTGAIRASEAVESCSGSTRIERS